MSATTAGRGGSPSLEVPDYWWYQARARLLEEALGPFVPAGGRLLDVGSADAPSAQWLHDRAAQHVAMDVDRRGLTTDGVCGSALALPLASASMDTVGAFDVIEHCDPESVAVGELHRVLRPGGVLVVSVPAYEWAWTDHDVANGHHRRYTKARIIDALTAAGFTIERATYAFATVFPMFTAERMVRRVRESRRGRGAYSSSTAGVPADVVSVPRIPPPVHHLLMGLCRLDERLLRSRDLPFGSSVLVAARRPR